MVLKTHKIPGGFNPRKKALNNIFENLIKKYKKSRMGHIIFKSEISDLNFEIKRTRKKFKQKLRNL